MGRMGHWAAALVALAFLAWAGEARAQIALGSSGWTQVNSGTSGQVQQNVTADSGSNRLMVVVVAATGSSGSTPSCSGTFGSSNLSQAVASPGSVVRKSCILTLNENGISAAGSGSQQLTVNISAGTISNMNAWVAFYTGVNQGTPVSATASNTSSNNVVAYSGSLTAPANGAVVIGGAEYSAATGVSYSSSSSLSYTARAFNSSNTAISVYDRLLGASAETDTVTETFTVGNTYTSAITAVAINPVNTITIGTGTNPSNTVTLGQTAAINAFTLATNTGTATITGLGVTLTNYSALSSVFLYSNANCTGGTQYGSSVTPSSNSVTFGSLSLGTSSTPTNYWVCGTAKTVSSSTAVTAVVSSGTTSTSGYTLVYSDTVGTLTVVPPTITIGTGTDPSNTVTYTQTAAIDAFTLTTNTGSATVSSINVTLTNYAALSSVFLYNNSSCSGGSRYGSAIAPSSNSVSFSSLSVGATTGGTSVWVCGTAAVVSSNTSVTAVVASATTSTTGYVFVNNDTAGTLTVVPPTITIGTGTNPSNTVTAGQTSAINAFTLATNVNTATVTSIVVNLTNQSALTGIFLYSTSTCTGGTQYGTTQTPAATVTFSSLGMSTSTTATNVWVCGTAATVASSTTVTAVVASATTSTSGYVFVNNDTAGTLTVNPPPTITIGTGTNPSNTVTQGQTAAINAFTLQTNTGTATVTSIAVNLTNQSALTGVFLYSTSTCTGGTQYGTTQTPASTVTFNSLSIGASTTAANFWVCGTAGTVSASTSVTAVVGSATTSTAGYVFANNDTAGTLTVNPPTITIGTGVDPSNTVFAGQTAAIDAFTLATNTGTATVTSIGVNLASPTALTSVFLYNNSSCTGGTRYGSAVTAATSVTFSGLSLSATTSATSIWVCGTAATVASTTSATAVVASAATSTSGYVIANNDSAGTLVVAVPSIIVGTGSDPSNTASNGQTAAIDAFTLATNTGTATVTSVAVSLSNPTALTNVFLYSNANCTGGSQYGSSTTPATSVSFGTLSIALTTSGTNLWICGTAGNVSSSTSVTAVVTSVTTSTSGYSVANSDTAGTLTVIPPSSSVTLTDPGTQPSSASVTAGAQNYIVGKIALTASPTSVGLTGLNVQNTGTAVPGADIQGVTLFTWSGTACNTTSAAVAGTTYYSSSLGRWIFSGSPILSVATSATTYCVGINVSSSAKAGNTFKMSIASADLSVATPNTISGSTTVNTAGTFTIAAGATAQEGNTSGSAPLVLLLNPGDGQTVSQSAGFRVQVQAFHPPSTAGGTDGVSKITTLTLSVDGGTGQNLLTGAKTNFDALVGPNARLYELQLSSLTAGTHTLQATASDGTNTTKSRKIVVNVVATTASGDGNLLVRDNASQMCTDCHAVKTHSSQATMATNTTVQKYGAWGMSCRDCHTPHKTPNIYVVKPNINPPNITTTYLSQVAIKFSTTTGDSGTSTAALGSFVNSDGSGPCQACHTRTADPISGNARWRSPVVGGNADTNHYTVAAGTETCTDCHSHTGGFAGAESQGGVKCSGCHSGTWKNMNGTVSNLTAHFVGSVKGTNDSPADSTVQAWNVANFATAVPAASRSCVGMCHGDHIHDLTSGSTQTTQHLYNAYVDASTYATRQDATGSTAQTKSTATRTRMDFDPSQANGGLCISCHLNAADQSRPAIDKTKYVASAHDGYTTANGTTTYNWQYNLHDGSVFLRDCTKCHSSPTEGTTPSAGGTGVQGPHFSANPSLLAGKVQGGATTGAGTIVCYNCHGNGTTGYNYSNKNVASEIASTYYHPVGSDQDHNTATEASATWGSGAYSGANRHVNCLDCHNPHQAANTLHTAGGTSGNALGAKSPLLGATGVAVNFTGVGTWTTVPSANFSKVSSLVAGNYEYQICFKCHTSWAWGSGSPPTALATGGSGLAETDLSTEFNPANHSGHPVVTSLNNYPNSPTPKPMATSQMTSAWSSVGTQTMTCSDCHGNDASSPVVQGPHGSAGKFILKGPNTYWPINSAGQYYYLGDASKNHNLTGLFCLNCHPIDNSGGIGTNTNYINQVHNEHGGNQSPTYVTCTLCHILIPHGGKVSRLIATQNAPSRYFSVYTYTGTPVTGTYLIQYKKASSPTSYSTGNCQATGSGFSGDPCSTHGAITGGENW